MWRELGRGGLKRRVGRGTRCGAENTRGAEVKIPTSSRAKSAREMGHPEHGLNQTKTSGSGRGARST